MVHLQEHGNFLYFTNAQCFFGHVEKGFECIFIMYINSFQLSTVVYSSHILNNDCQIVQYI